MRTIQADWIPMEHLDYKECVATFKDIKFYIDEVTRKFERRFAVGGTRKIMFDEPIDLFGNGEKILKGVKIDYQGGVLHTFLYFGDNEFPLSLENEIHMVQMAAITQIMKYFAVKRYKEFMAEP